MALNKQPICSISHKPSGGLHIYVVPFSVSKCVQETRGGFHKTRSFDTKLSDDATLLCFNRTWLHTEVDAVLKILACLRAEGKPTPARTSAIALEELKRTFPEVIVKLLCGSKFIEYIE